MSLKRNLKSLIIIAVGFTGLSCSEEHLRDFNTIKYGTSFGMCEGYCTISITIQNDSALYEKSSLSDEATYPSTECESNFPQYADFRSQIDPEVFYDLPETIGCPDCADGGAEWIELQSSKTSHRVTFELGKAPEEFNNYIENLRFYIQRMEATCP